MTDNTSRLRRVLKNTLDNKQNRIAGDDGLLGDGNGLVATGDPNMVYVRVAGGVVARVYNDRVPLLHDLPVKIGFDPLHPSRLRVLDRSEAPIYGQEGASFINVGNHADTHRFPLGRDPSWIELRQFMPLRLTPIPGTLTVHLYPGVVKLPGGAYQEITGAVYDLTSYVPTTSGKARYTLISISDAGTVTFTAGAEVDIASLDATTVPTAPADTAYELGMVRTYYGQTEIIEAASDTDVWDLRFPMPHEHAAPTFALDDLTDVDTTGVAVGQTIVWDDGTSTWVPGNVGTGTGSAPDYILIRDEKASGTEGGTFTGGAWQTRVLNTEVNDAGSHAALAGNQITLAAGTYRVHAVCPGYGVAHHQARLRNITDDATTLLGSSNYSGLSSAASYSIIVGRFTIAAPKVFEVQHYCNSTKTTNGLGTGFNTGEINIFALIELWKEA